MSDPVHQKNDFLVSGGGVGARLARRIAAEARWASVPCEACLRSVSGIQIHCWQHFWIPAMPYPSPQGLAARTPSASPALRAGHDESESTRE